MRLGSGAECFRCGEEQDLSPEVIAKLAAELPLEAALRVEPAEYERRLAVCGACEDLRAKILCARCGCFVQFRARIQGAYCPHPGGDLWARPAVSEPETGSLNR